MKAYRHYSFDLWLTLIRSNPNFKTLRADYFFAHHNPRKKTREEVARVFRQIDLAANAVNEKTGKNLDADELYCWVLLALNDHDAQILQNVDLQGLMSNMEALVWQEPPIFFADEVPKVLEQLSRQATLSLLCNTGFISGKILRKVLKHLGLEPYLSFQLYSDESGFSKPNPRFFVEMIHRAAQLHENSPIAKQDIIHVGDNPTADYKGALDAGINGFLVHQPPPSNCLSNLLT